MYAEPLQRKCVEPDLKWLHFLIYYLSNEIIYFDNIFSYLLQYRNASNPLAHYDGTAEEILEACDGR